MHPRCIITFPLIPTLPHPSACGLTSIYSISYINSVAYNLLGINLFLTHSEFRPHPVFDIFVLFLIICFYAFPFRFCSASEYFIIIHFRYHLPFCYLFAFPCFRILSVNSVLGILDLSTNHTMIAQSSCNHLSHQLPFKYPFLYYPY